MDLPFHDLPGDFPNPDEIITKTANDYEAELIRQYGNPVEEYDVHDLGVMNSQYFQGAGTSFTRWDEAYTGTGDTAYEAMEDALGQAAEAGWDTRSIKNEFNPDDPETVEAVVRQANPEADEDDLADCDSYHYVVLYVRGPDKPTQAPAPAQESKDANGDNDDIGDIISDVAREGVRLNTKRMLQPGYEICHATGISEHLARAMVDTIKELDPCGYEEFAERNSEELEALEAVEAGTNNTEFHRDVEEWAYGVLQDYLSTHYCLPFTFVGHHEGDSSLGCWISEEGLEEAVEAGRVVKVEPSLSSFTQWLHRHGNFADDIKYVWLHDQAGALFRPDTDALYNAKTRELIWHY